MVNSMIIKLIPKQIPAFWEAIKFTVKNANEVEDRHFQQYCNELLQALLNEKAQCFARLSDERVLEALLITRIQENKQTGERFLYAQSLYSWQVKPLNQWEGDFKFVIDFAKASGCQYISCQSINPRMWEIYERIGLRELQRTFILNI
jgi:hypothetical protein